MNEPAVNSSFHVILLGRGEALVALREFIEQYPSTFTFEVVEEVSESQCNRLEGKTASAVVIDGDEFCLSHIDLVRTSVVAVPVIVVTQTADFDSGFLDAGVQDVFEIRNLEFDSFVRAIVKGGCRETFLKRRELLGNYRASIESVPIGAFRVGPLPSFDLVITNTAFDIKMGRASNSEVASFQQFFGDPDEASEFFEIVTRVGGVSAYEARFRRIDGQQRYVQLTAKVSSVRGIDERFIDGTLEDVTDSRAARDEQLKLKYAIETMQLGVTVTDLKGRIRYTNPAEAEMHGYQVDELIGLNSRVFSPPEYWQPLVFAKVLEIGRWARDTINVRKDGSVFPVRLLSDVVLDERGVPSGIITTCEDISEREAALLALRNEEERYRNLIETIPHGIQENDLDGIITFSNRAHHQIFGYEDGELIGRNFCDLAVSAEDSRQMIRTLRMLAVEQPEPKSFISPNRRKDGEIIDVQVDWNYKRDRDGLLTGFIAIITDVTERLHAEQQVKVLELAVDSMDLGLTIVDTAGNIIFTNPAEARMHGFERDELLGREAKVFGVETTQTGANGIDFVRTKNWLRESVNVRKDGSIFPVQLMSVPVTDDNGDPVGLITTCEDITLRKQSEEALKTTKDMIEKLHDVARRLQECDQQSEVCSLTVRAAVDVLDLKRCLVVFEGERVERTISLSNALQEALDDIDIKEVIESVRGKFNGPSITGEIPEGLCGFSQMMIIPLEGLGIFLTVSASPSVFATHQMNLAELLLGHAVAAVQRVRLEAELRNQATHDPLTGVRNRRYFHEIIQLETERARRVRRPIGFLMVDVDRFKEINDRFGHQMGDSVLKDLADLLEEQVRKSDMVVRFGGDEFLIVLVEPEGEMECVVGRIHQGLVAWNDIQTDIDFDITLSIGDALWDPVVGGTIEESLAIADRIMYESKRSETKKVGRRE